jgi:hypothetical protein
MATRAEVGVIAHLAILQEWMKQSINTAKPLLLEEKQSVETSQ